MNEVLQKGSIRYGWLAILLVLLSAVSLQAQTRYTITGKVKDLRTGEALTGVSVKLEGGSGNGVTTGQDGTYSLSAVITGKAQLVFTYVGYKIVSKPVQAGSGSITIDAALEEDVVKLDEVVVTGTAVATSKKQLGNAISTISSKDLANGVATSVDQAMAGKISGAQINQNSGNPAGGISVRLRGTSTINGSSDPLYIVDGVIINNSSSQLIDLGGYSQNRLVDINPADIDRIEIIKGAAAAAIYGSRASNGVVQIFTKKGKSGKPVVTFSTQLRYSELRKKIEWNQYPFRFNNFTSSDTSKTAVTRYDYQDMIFHGAFGNENNISVSGGSDNTTYLMSGSFLQNDGIVRNTSFKRGTVRLRLDHTFNSWLKTSLGIAYSLSPSREIPNGGINEAYGALTGFIFSNNYIDPHANAVTGVYPSTSPTSIVTRTNPLEAINRFDFRQKTSRLIGNFQVMMTPVKDLSINYTLGYDNSTQLATGYIPVGNTTPSYNTGYSTRADRIALLVNNDLNVAYKWKVSNAIQTTWAAGATGQTEQVNQSAIIATQLSPIAQVITAGSTLVPTEVRSTLNIFGSYVQGTIGINNRLFITGAVRNDAASSFGSANRWQYYPKLSGSYLISDEAFWKNSFLGKVAQNFKLRASYGQAGNLTAIGAYDRFTSYTTASLSGLPGVVAPVKLGNTDMKPERQTEKEVGVDASFLNDRLGVEFSYYQKDVKDLLLPVDLAPSQGYTSQVKNIGNMTNKGFEILLRGTPVRTEKFQWNTVVNFSKNTNRVTDIPGGLVTFTAGFSAVAAVNGRSLGVFYGPYFARKADGSLLLDASGIPQRERSGRDAVTGQPTGTILNKVIGDPNPKWTGAVINDFSVGTHWTFRAQVDVSHGGQMFNFTRRVGERDYYGGLKGYEKELKGEVPKGTSIALFSIYENYIEDASYVKLRELSASYGFKPKFLRGNTMRVTFAARNLFSIDNYSGWDPETSAAGQTNAVRGFDFVEVPIPRSYALGVNMSF